MSKKGKKYLEAKALIKPGEKYPIGQAVELVKKVSYSNFDATIEIHIKTRANPKYNDQMIRCTVTLPNWNWKSIKVAAFVSPDKIEEAKKMWADIVGNEDLIKNIEDWKIEFDVLVTTPDMMRNLAKVAKVLWPRWLMPSPKAWTVSPELSSTIEEIKKWRVELKLDKTWNIHLGIWNDKFEDKQLEENINAVMKTLESNRPEGVKWKLVEKVFLAPSIWPSVEINY